MRRAVILLAAMAAMVLLATGVALTQTPGERDTNRYIVVLNDGVDDPGQAASGMARRHDLQVGFVYRHALKGFSAVIPNDRVAEVRADSRVAYVERDGTMRAIAKPGAQASAAAGQELPWGIDKIDADISSTQAGDGSGAVSNVNAYIIDTGIDTAHADLNVVGHVNFASGPNKDCHGHGTHVAGTVAAEDNTVDVVGVAPGTPQTGVKVLGCGGTGSTSGVIKGVDWVTANAQKPALANMSLGGGASKALDEAVVKSANSGVFYSIAAGNDGAEACNYSPARAGAGTNNGIATVAATNKTDGETTWSNYGACVDIWAPGANILSTKKGGGTTTMSGTSMAAPHVGGGGALYLSKNTGASSSTVEAALKSAAQTPGTTSKDKRLILREYVGTF